MELVGKTLDFVKKNYGNLENKNKKKYCEFLQNYGLDEKAISATLLYDFSSDVKGFGIEVNKIIRGLKKFNMLAAKAGKGNKPDKVRKMLIATIEDLRILLIKLLERLYKMRSLSILGELERKRISRDTMEIYAPIAYRLGLSDLKWELEDLSFRYLNTQKYFELKRKIKIKRGEREKFIRELEEQLIKELKKKKIKYEIFGRPKHFYSIHKKMVDKGKKFEEIYDLLGLRIIVETSEDCYRVLGIVNTLWDTIPERLKDFIVSPKGGIYQSLHVTFFYNQIPVEVQIRTKRMNDMAEEGVAAHWGYKKIEGEKKFNKQLSWLRRILDFGTESDKEFLYKLKLDLFENKIYCFTPKGKIIELNEGSSIVDFAYAVHSEIGDKCTGGRLNGKFVSLRQKLKNGDEVEVLTSTLHKPSRNWLSFVKTRKAFEKIRQHFSITGMPGRRKLAEEEVVIENFFIGVEGDYDLRMAKCCNPLPEEDLIGVVSSFKNAVVHSYSCKNVKDVKNKIGAFWIEDFNNKIKLKILAEERLGIFAEILNAVAAMGIGVQTAQAKNASDEIAECTLDINFNGLKELKKVIERVNHIEGVRKIRIE
tara:strand:+ start:18099 stop:19877 length:1779 start_codon:yes stop_codon:yes gene_type:complete